MKERDNSHADTARQVRLGVLLDRPDIHDCLCRISRAIDRFDRELFLSGYHDDAVIDAGSLVGPPGKVYDKGAHCRSGDDPSYRRPLFNRREMSSPDDMRYFSRPERDR